MSNLHIFALSTFALSISLAGCSGADGGATRPESVDKTLQALVGGAGAQAIMPVTPYGGQNGTWSSETSTLISNPAPGIYRDIVAYNTEDPDHESYSPTDRYVSYGSASVGWSWATHPASTTGGYSPINRLAPPPGWGALWGDPGLGQIPGTPYVYLSTVALPESKWPCERMHNGVCVNRPGIHGSVQPYAGGACIGRSTDGGVSFSVSASDCLHTAVYDFYDGSDVAGAGTGMVLAAFNNVPQSTIDVWRAPGATASFSQVPNPFPGKASYIHPRLVTSRNNSSFIFILAAVGKRGELWLNRYDTVNDTWGQAPDWPMLVASDYANDGTGLPQALRPAAGYDLMVNIYRHTGSLARIVYTSAVGGRTILRAAQCGVDNPSFGCASLTGATIDPGVSAFNPAVGTADDPSLGTVWSVTWEQQDTPGGHQLALFAAGLNRSGGIYGIRQETAYQTPCPRNDGYWGDYDVHLGVIDGSPGQAPTFLRSFTDSTDGSGASQCFFQWAWESSPQQVSQLQDSFQ